MRLLDLTLPTPAENLALDEALLDFCQGGFDDEILRFWEPAQPFVVLGYANRARSEADIQACCRGQIPVLRRCSGGGTVLQGPGCLNYSLICRIDDQRHWSIPATNVFVMNRNRDALRDLLDAPVEVEGHTDLAIGGMKFSGNAQRRKRQWLIFHGTFLINLDIALVEEVLRMPSRQPGYRGARSHRDFLRNLNVSPEAVRKAIASAWEASGVLSEIPDVSELARSKYSLDEWNLKFL